MPKLIIFDVDGTLVDSETQCLIALTKVIPELQFSIEELSMLYRGRKLTSILADIESRLGLRLRETILEDYRAAYSALVQEGLNAFPHVAEILDKLTVKSCVASNAPLVKIDMNLCAAQLDRYFPLHHRFSAYEAQAWKPDPKLFLEAAAAFETSVEDCIVIEDSLAGLQAAHAAGMPVLQFCEPGTKPMTDRYFSDYRELPALLGSSFLANA